MLSCDWGAFFFLPFPLRSGTSELHRTCVRLLLLRLLEVQLLPAVHTPLPVSEHRGCSTAQNAHMHGLPLLVYRARGIVGGGGEERQITSMLRKRRNRVM